MAAAKHDFESFASLELQQRTRFGYPPFGSLARVIMRGPDLSETEGFADSVVRKLKTIKELQALDCRILGPAPPPLAKLRGKYRFHCMIQSQEPEHLNRMLLRLTHELKTPKDVQYVIDIDPMDTL